MPQPKQSLAEMLNEGWMSLNKFAKVIGVAYPTAQRMYKRGDINATRVGGIIRVYTTEVRRFLREGNVQHAKGDTGGAIPPVAPTLNKTDARKDTE